MNHERRAAEASAPIDPKTIRWDRELAKRGGWWSRLNPNIVIPCALGFVAAVVVAFAFGRERVVEVERRVEVAVPGPERVVERIVELKVPGPSAGTTADERKTLYLYGYHKGITLMLTTVMGTFGDSKTFLAAGGVPRYSDSLKMVGAMAALGEEIVKTKTPLSGEALARFLEDVVKPLSDDSDFTPSAERIRFHVENMERVEREARAKARQPR